MTTRLAALLYLCAATLTPRAALAQPLPAPGAAPASTVTLDSQTLETTMLTRHVQLTSRDQFIKAGEAYFSHDNDWIIFQAIAVPEHGHEPDPFYAMYVARLARDADGHISGLADIALVSPPHSANTCGWFDPVDPTKVIFGSTLARPADEDPSGFQVGTHRYRWQFPSEMNVVQVDALALINSELNSYRGPSFKAIDDAPLDKRLHTLIDRPNYDAECSYSKDGRFILYGHVEPRPAALPKDAPYRPDANIYIRDTRTGRDIPIVVAPGYDGGPFFSPDGKRICYRSDRQGNDLLQLYIADLAFDDQGVPTGISREYQLTDNGAVNWAPYWHPSGRYLVYASSEIGHQNYEVFAVEIDEASLAAAAQTPEGQTANATSARRARVTFADGADVLPVFSDDGSLMMWTCQRGPLAPGETKPSSQVWVAEVVGAPAFGAVPKP